MRLFVTIYEETREAALAAIRSLQAPHDGIELRAERFAALDLQALRASTEKPILLTYRGSRVPDVRAALAAGIDLVDVEWSRDVVIEVPERTVLSHHDYEGMREVESIVADMRTRGCAHVKLAATPANFADNERLLALLPGTVIGMGERGLYSRILAPFLGSELAFVAASNVAAPSQLTLERALEIYGRAPLRAERVFAVVGNPAGHSLSPSIHNRLFRDKGVPAAYTIASIESFAEIEEAFLRGNPCGLSVTAPFKDDALRFAQKIGADVASNANRAKAVNTLVNVGGRIFADNTDVDGFAALIPREATKAAVVGAGGTARAALVALADANIPARVYNRTASKGDAPLGELRHFDGDLIINTLPGNVEVALPSARTIIHAAYGHGRTGGLALLQAQAVRQHALFMKVFDGL
ncbi:MAG TPA: type I 3-dehydroquinate dehydratase [Thermoanaerobaculia bacterium]|jgi:3-dehydroquinate dehydratase type I